MGMGGRTCQIVDGNFQFGVEGEKKSGTLLNESC